jgi:CubicO group peptidase (beta-lactamase class C family)
MRRAAFLLIAGMAITAASCTIGRIVYYNFSGVDDYRIFPQRKMAAGNAPFHFKENIGDWKMPSKVTVDNTVVSDLDAFLKDNDTLAFLVFKDDMLVREAYFNGHSREAPSLSFSMAKAFISILIGMAINDGLIHSENQPVTDFVPELAKNGFNMVTLRHLLQMTSGLDYWESDIPFGIHTRFYYSDNLEEMLLKLELDREPGTEWSHKSGENELLGLVLRNSCNCSGSPSINGRCIPDQINRHEAFRTYGGF